MPNPEPPNLVTVETPTGRFECRCGANLFINRGFVDNHRAYTCNACGTAYGLPAKDVETPMTPAEKAVTEALRLAAHFAGEADMDVPLEDFLPAAIEALVPHVAPAAMRQLAETESSHLYTGPRSDARGVDAVLVTDILARAEYLEAGR